MVDVKGSISGYMPDITSQAVKSTVFWIVVIIILAVITGVVVFFWVMKKKFNKKITIFEEINGKLRPMKKDIACEMKLQPTGDSIFYLLKNKKYVPKPHIQIAPNTYWFEIREDDEWINFDLNGVNKLSKEANAFFVDKEMRYARASLQKSLKDRYDKVGFWQKYGGLIAYVALIVATGIMMYLLFDKYLGISAVTNEGVKQAGEVMDKVKEVMASMDNICTGSGVKPA